MIASVETLWLAWVSINDDTVLGGHDCVNQIFRVQLHRLVSQVARKEPSEITKTSSGILMRMQATAAPHALVVRGECARGMQRENAVRACECLPLKTSKIYLFVALGPRKS